MKHRDSRGTLESVLRAFVPMSVVVLLTITGCNPFAPDEFVVRVDSITGPASISSTETLTVRFLGPLGPNLCYHLDHVHRNRTPDALELIFHGEDGGGNPCIFQPVFDHQEEIAPPFEDPFIILVRQPDDTVLAKVVRIQ